MALKNKEPEKKELFLGIEPVKIHKSSFREDTSHGINSINGYCQAKSVAAYDKNSGLNIAGFVTLGIDTGRSYELPSAHYYPIKIRSDIEYIQPVERKGRNP